MRLLSGLVVLLVQYIVFTGAVLAGNIIINEFDLNPAGKDAGNEWIVLYNPSEVEIDMSAWTLETTHGKRVIVRIPQDTIMLPKGYWTYIHPRQWLDNEDELIILRDAEGIEVDRTLIILPSEFVPYASFIYSPEELSVNQMIIFDASPSYSLDPDAAILSYEWNFGDGTIGTGKVVNHSYSSASDYTVALVVVDSDGKIRRKNTRLARIIIK